MNLPKETKTLIDLKQFKKGMIGLLRVLAQESLEHQRLDHYSLYSTMMDIVEKYIIPLNLEALQDMSTEELARMVLNFPSEDKKLD